MKFPIGQLRELIREAMTKAYEILGVAPSADADAIKKAYRNKTIALHPDRNPGKDTTPEMVKVNVAYGLLSDPAKRSRYDMSGDKTLGDWGQGGSSSSSSSSRSGSSWADDFWRQWDPNTGRSRNAPPPRPQQPPPSSQQSTTEGPPCPYCHRNISYKVDSYGKKTRSNHFTMSGGDRRCNGSGKTPAPAGSSSSSSSSSSSQGSTSSDYTRRYVNTTGRARKFWEVSVKGSTVKTRWGRIGSEGQTTVKDFRNSELALRYARRLTNSKLDKGYVQSSGSSGNWNDSDWYSGRSNSQSSAPPPRPKAAPSGRPQRSKQDYKVYPFKGQRRVVRVGGKLFGTHPGGNLTGGGQTKFQANDRARVAKDGNKMKVTKDIGGSDHTQTWDPVDEAIERMIDELVIESLEFEEEPADMELCEECKGVGMTRDEFGEMGPCEECDGLGYVDIEPPGGW